MASVPVQFVDARTGSPVADVVQETVNMMADMKRPSFLDIEIRLRMTGKPKCPCNGMLEL
jgi:hypothetical protein